jgi:hypothetical protein
MQKWKDESRRCNNCESLFRPSNYNQVYCSNKCRIDDHNEYMARAVEHYKTCPLAKEERDED